MSLWALFWREPLFWLSQIIYWFLLYYPSGEPSFMALVIKCLPVASLALSIYLEDEPQNEADDGKVSCATLTF